MGTAGPSIPKTPEPERKYKPVSTHRDLHPPEKHQAKAMNHGIIRQSGESSRQWKEPEVIANISMRNPELPCMELFGSLQRKALQVVAKDHPKADEQVPPEKRAAASPPSSSKRKKAVSGFQESIPCPENCYLPSYIGHLKFNKKLGTGGFGQVYSVEHNGIKGALKQIRGEPNPLNKRKRNPDEVAKKSWDEGIAKEREFQIRVLGHPNIIQILAYFEQGDDYSSCLLLELGDHSFERYVLLGSFLHKNPKNTATETVTYTTQIVTGLAFLHNKNIIHRDIKPGNIIVHNTAEGRQLKITDFGCASDLEFGKQLELQHIGPETPRYAAPESKTPHINAKGHCVYIIDHAVDIFAFGIMLADLVAYTRFTPDEHQINAELETLMKRATVNAASDRPTASEILDYKERKADIFSPE